MRRPRFIAEQSRHAAGPLGRLIAFIMAFETRAANLRAIAALEVAMDDHILDVGCGPGRSLKALAARAPAGRVVGVDPSRVMTGVASRNNRSLVRAARVEVATASAELLPFGNGAFDKALCVHVVYFWRDLNATFCEIARVLKPGGHLVLLCRTSDDEAAVRSFPSDVYRFPTAMGVRAAIRGAGFDIEGPCLEQPSGQSVLVVATKVPLSLKSV